MVALEIVHARFSVVNFLASSAAPWAGSMRSPGATVAVASTCPKSIGGNISDFVKVIRGGHILSRFLCLLAIVLTYRAAAHWNKLPDNVRRAEAAALLWHPLA